MSEEGQIIGCCMRKSRVADEVMSLDVTMDIRSVTGG